MPLPNRTVIHPLWSEHHRPTASASLLGRCTITRPDVDSSDDVYDPDTLQYEPSAPEVVYTGPCRVQALSASDARKLFGEQDVTTSTTRVVVEWDVIAEIGDVVTVTTADDPDLVGRKLRVLNIIRGTEQWERDLYCEDWQG